MAILVELLLGSTSSQAAAGGLNGAGQKHVSSAMVEAWCKSAKSNASPAAMHKLLQVPHLLAGLQLAVYNNTNSVQVFRPNWLGPYSLYMQISNCWDAQNCLNPATCE